MAGPKEPDEHPASPARCCQHRQHGLAAASVTLFRIASSRCGVLVLRDAQQCRHLLPLRLRTRQPQTAPPPPNVPPLRTRPPWRHPIGVCPVRPSLHLRVSSVLNRQQCRRRLDLGSLPRQALASVGHEARRVDRVRLSMDSAPDHSQAMLRSSLTLPVAVKAHPARAARPLGAGRRPGQIRPPNPCLVLPILSYDEVSLAIRLCFMACSLALQGNTLKAGGLVLLRPSPFLDIHIGEDPEG